jgi:hypothetical protein
MLRPVFMKFQVAPSWVAIGGSCRGANREANLANEDPVHEVFHGLMSPRVVINKLVGQIFLRWEHEGLGGIGETGVTDHGQNALGVGDE